MPRRRWGARLAAVSLGLGLVVGTELTLRAFGVAPGPGWTPPRLVYVVQNGEVQGEFQAQAGAHFVSESSAASAAVRTSRSYALGSGTGFPVNGSMRDEHFTRAPSPGVERYFVLGGSAAMGQAPVASQSNRTVRAERLPNGVRALPDRFALSGQVEQRLRDAGRTVEVINAGMIAQDSAGVLRIAKEVLQYSPTGLILYLGNNEGIGLSAGMGEVPVPRLEAVAGLLHRVRLYRLLANRLVPTRQRLEQAPTDTLSGLQPEVLGHITRAQWRASSQPLMRGDVPTDDVYKALLARFDRNLRAVVHTASAAGVSVTIVPTPPHLGYSPFYSTHAPGRSAEDVKAREEREKEAEVALRRGNLDRAARSAQEAVALAPYSAKAWYLLGQSLNDLERYDEAVDALVRAQALDLSRKRSQPAFGDIAIQVCASLACRATSAHDAITQSARSVGLSVYEQRFGDHEHLHPDGNAWVASLVADLLLAE